MTYRPPMLGFLRQPNLRVTGSGEPGHQQPEAEPGDQQHQRGMGAVAGEGLRQTAHHAAFVQQSGAVPHRFHQGRQPVQVDEALHATHQQAGGQEQQDDLADLEEHPAGQPAGAPLDQPGGGQGQQETQGGAEEQAVQRLAALLQPQAVEEEHRLGALAAHRDGRQQGRGDAAGFARRLGQAGFQLLLQVAAVVAHPQHHVGDEPGGEDDDGGLEGFQGVPGELALQAQHGPRQGPGQGQAAADAGPQVAGGDAAVAPGLDPGVEDAYHQDGFDAFAPDDEEGVTHGGS